MKYTSPVLSSVGALAMAGYVLDRGSRRDMSDYTMQYRWNHIDGSYYVVTEWARRDRSVKSWYYRGLGGNAKSDPRDDTSDVTLIAHVKKNKKTAPKTITRRRTRTEINRANFVLYD